jgi:hypothetical protein
MTTITEYIMKFARIVDLFICRHMESLMIGIIGSLIASILFFIFLICRRPKMEIFPAIVKNTTDSMCYIILWLSNKLRYRKKAIDVKVSTMLLGNMQDKSKKYFFGRPKIPLGVPVPLHTSEFPLLESRWNKDKSQRYLIIPLMLDKPNFFKDIYNQINPETIDKDTLAKIQFFANGNNWENWIQIDRIPWEEIRDCFLRIFTGIYDEIQVSVNYQDDTSGIRKTITSYICHIVEGNITQDINWLKKAKLL